MECLIKHLLHVYCCTLLLSPYIVIAADGSPKAGNRIELEAMLDQVRNNNQTAQMAMLTAHKERVEWDHEGGRLPLQSQYGKVCFPAPPRCPPPYPSAHQHAVQGKPSQSNSAMDSECSNLGVDLLCMGASSEDWCRLLYCAFLQRVGAPASHVCSCRNGRNMKRVMGQQ